MSMPEPREDLFLIGSRPGYTPQIGSLVAMLECTRWVTLRDVEGLSVEELDQLHDDRSNSIGALLAHIAAVEFRYQVGTLEGRGFTREEERQWGAALELGERARREIRGHELDHYLAILGSVRARTLRELARRTDEWLAEASPWWGGFQANNHFKWFHVMEDEISHRGQIRWLRKRLPGVRA